MRTGGGQLPRVGPHHPAWCQTCRLALPQLGHQEAPDCPLRLQDVSSQLQGHVRCALANFPNLLAEDRRVLNVRPLQDLDRVHHLMAHNTEDELVSF